MKQLLPVLLVVILVVLMVAGCTPGKPNSTGADSPEAATLIPGATADGTAPTGSTDSQNSASEELPEAETLKETGSPSQTSNEDTDAADLAETSADTNISEELDDSDEIINDGVEVVVDNNVGIGGN